jgi:hypothetical protein
LIGSTSVTLRGSMHKAGADREIETLARAIVGAEEGSELLALARRVADCESRLRRVRSAQMFVVNTARRLEDFRADSSGVVHGASRNSVTPVRAELRGKVGDGVNQAADLISATVSIPSLNFIPLTTFGNWF